MTPYFVGKEKLARRLMHWLAIDKVNEYHSRSCDTPGVPFVQRLLDDLEIKLDVRNSEVLDRLPQGGFVTISNHPFGALDGISLIKLVGEKREDFKVMVNMMLNHISAMRPNFINVNAVKSDDPEKRAVSMKGIVEAMRHVHDGHVLGFFPAGAVAKFSWRLRFNDLPWKPNITHIIRKLQVPIVPIYFHGHNSLTFTILGMINWKLRTLRMPTEVFRRKGDTLHITVGEPIDVAQQALYETDEDLAQFLRKRTLELKKSKK